MDQRNAELAKDAEFVQLLVVDRDADATVFLRDDNHWARPWRCGVLGETREGWRSKVFGTDNGGSLSCPKTSHAITYLGHG